MQNILNQINKNLKMVQQYDLIVVGAGCVGMAATYYAVKQNKRVCIVEKNSIEDQNRIWASSLNLIQNRIQYNQEYMTRFVLASEKEWKDLEKQFGQQFLIQLGNLWFGDKNYEGDLGKISRCHKVLQQINASLPEDEQIDYLYIEKINKHFPEFMRAFKPSAEKTISKYEWNNWSALYLTNGGTINMRLVYNSFLNYIRQRKNIATIYDEVKIQKHKTVNSDYKHQFMISSGKGKTTIASKKVFIATGISTPYFLKDIMDYPYLVENNYKKGQKNTIYQIEEYVESLIEIEEGYEAFYSKIPPFYNMEQPNPHFDKYSVYGYGHYQSEGCNLGGKFIKLGLDQCVSLDSLQKEQQYLSKKSYDTPNQNDDRVKKITKYASQRMVHLIAQSRKNKQQLSANIYYQGMNTLFDYLQRKDKSIVVSSGGCTAKFHPLLAKTAIRMLFEPESINQELIDETVIGNFIKRSRFPLKHYVNDRLERLNFVYPTIKQLKTVIIGAGCSGLYTAHRLNKAKHEAIGVFDLSERISGRLKSFTFHDTMIPMELGGMRYIPKNHVLVEEIINSLGIPTSNFETEGDPIQNKKRIAYLRNSHYRMKQWEETQQVGGKLITNYNLRENIIGMTAYQIMSFSFYKILTSFENVGLLVQLFLSKTKDQIENEKKRLNILGQFIPIEDAYYRNWQNYVYQSKENSFTYNINLTLFQWNRLKPVILFRYPYKVKDNSEYEEKVPFERLYPLYKFGFQNVLQSQFGHETYQFVAEQNGYYSNTSNASYLDQVMTYLLDFGKVSYRSLLGGFDNINYAMVNELLDHQTGLPARNGGIYLGHKLVNIQKMNGRYLLTFHVKTPSAKKQNKYHSELLSGVKRSQLSKIVHQKLGQLIPLPNKPGYFSVQFTAEKIVLGIPKKAIQTLCEEIQLLQQPLTNYESLYETDFKQFSKIFDYSCFKQQKNLMNSCAQLSLDQKNLRSRLLKKYSIYFQSKDESCNLTQSQIQLLNQLSNKFLFETSIKKLKIDYSFEEKKINKFMIDKPLLPQYLAQLADSTQIMPAMKIIMNFTKNWWDPNIRINQQYQKKYKNGHLINRFEQMRGVSVTDLPLRQTLYFSTGNENLLLGSYNDMGTTDFWTTLHNNFEKQWKPSPSTKQLIEEGSFKTIIDSPPYTDVHPAKQVMVREVLRQLSEMHNINVKEEWLKECVYQLWGNDIFGGGYHNFYSGYYTPTVMKCIRKPWQSQSIHFVGEAYSNVTGWVEGAFQTAQRLLQQQFGISPFIEGYYPGY